MTDESLAKKIRDSSCPICGQQTALVLQLHFGKRLNLPTEVDVRHCRRDNFLFSGNGCQSDYDRYYEAVVNDSCHQEVSGGIARSPISKLQNSQLLAALGGFFDTPRRVLDFGCGGASLLLELATNFPSSSFFGCDPGPAAQNASDKAKMLGLSNLFIVDMNESGNRAPYDLVIVSHVIEHVLDFDLINLLRGFLAESGLLYVEVPSSLRYETQPRLEFLYYFDRLHVNHFTPQSLVRLVHGYDFGYLRHFEYAFPYRDGGEYPALGMLFKKGGAVVDLVSPDILEGTDRYIKGEKERAKATISLLDRFEGAMIWGIGDNFYRSTENGGPLSNLRNMMLLDRRPHEASVRGRLYQTVEPQDGIRNSRWPVVIAVSEGRKEIGCQVADIDANRRVLYI